jgi:hypothetical protein
VTPDHCRPILLVVLRVGGGLACTAVLAIFLPTAWMAAIHRWLGLGEFPDAAITQYLARSVSAFYAIFGGLTILASLDVRRFGPVITFLAVVTMAFGAVITGVDAMARMPPCWMLAEGPPTFGIGPGTLLLNRRVQRDVHNVATDPGREDSHASER